MVFDVGANLTGLGTLFLLLKYVLPLLMGVILLAVAGFGASYIYKNSDTKVLGYVLALGTILIIILLS